MLLNDGPERSEFARAVRGVCASFYESEGEHHHRPFDRDLWRQLGALGVWGLLAGEGGTCRDVACAAEALGAEGIAGPIAATFAASILPDAVDPDQLGSGSLLVTIADDQSLVPWLPVADTVLHVRDATVSTARVTSVDGPVATLAGEPWAHARIKSGEALPDSRRAGRNGSGRECAPPVGQRGDRAVNVVSQCNAWYHKLGIALNNFLQKWPKTVKTAKT